MNRNITKEQELFERVCDTAVIVRDEHCSKRLARLYSANILKQNIKIITLDEIAECIYLPNSADSLLKMIAEDKRVFAFYQTVLNDPKKQWMKDLNITGYFNAVHVAQQFYALFNELNENMIAAETVENTISDNQQPTWKIFREIYDALNIFLTQHGLTDKIFIRTNKAVDTNINNILTLTAAYKSVVLLDCWGETLLTGYMLRKVNELLGRTKQTEIILTVPDNLIDQQTWTLRWNEVTLDLLAGNPKNKKFTFVKAASPAEVYYKAVSCVAEQPSEKTTIIDLDTSHNFYKYMLSDKFGIMPQIPYFNCRLYVWLDSMYKLLDSITRNKSASVLLCDINVLRDAIYTDKFIGLYFGSDDQELLSDLRQFIDNKISSTYIYFDINNTILQQEIDYWQDPERGNKPEEAEKYLKIADRLAVMNSHIDQILNMKSVSELKEFLYCEIICKRFFYDENFKVFETFFTAIEDTESLERMGIVANWDKLFPIRERVPQVGINLLKILADYLKDQKIPLSSESNIPNNTILTWTSIDKYEWTSFGKLILLNMNEKVFPKLSYANSFFSESQRLTLKLPNSDDAVSQERLVLTDLLRLHDNVTIISVENEAQDMFGSGFIDEIKFYCTRSNIPYSETDITFSDDYASLLQNVLGQTETSLPMNKTTDPLLFSFDMDKDLKNGVFRLSASRLKSLLKPEEFEDQNQPRKTQNVLTIQTGKNHYTKYYINSMIGVKFFEQQRIPRVAGLVLGNLIHDIYRDTVKNIKEEISGKNTEVPYNLTDSHWSSEHIQDMANNIISKIYQPYRNSYLYKIPDDWTKEYLKDHILKHAVNQFCRLFDEFRSEYGSQPVFVMPESDYSANPEANKKIYITGDQVNEHIVEYNNTLDDDTKKQKINIDGNVNFVLDARADFYVKNDNMVQIIDYKTGSKEGNQDVQLMAYEYSYLDEKNNEDNKNTENQEVKSFFFNIFENDDKDLFQPPKTYKEYTPTLLDYIHKAINPIFELKCFAPNEKIKNQSMKNNDKQ